VCLLRGTDSVYIIWVMLVFRCSMCSAVGVRNRPWFRSDDVQVIADPELCGSTHCSLLSTPGTLQTRVHYTACIIKPTLYSLQYTVYTTYPAIYSIHYTACNIQSTLYSLHYTPCHTCIEPALYILHYASNTTQPVLYSIHYGACTIQPILPNPHYTA